MQASSCRRVPSSSPAARPRPWPGRPTRTSRRSRSRTRAAAGRVTRRDRSTGRGARGACAPRCVPKPVSHPRPRRRRPGLRSRRGTRAGSARGEARLYPASLRWPCRIGSRSPATAPRSTSRSNRAHRCSTSSGSSWAFGGVKDGCAPQGQCGCCTVLVDGQPRVACVTPPTRVAGRAVTTVERTGRRRARSPARGVRRDGWVAVRVLHAGDRRACGLAARSQQWRRHAGRDRPRARGAPVPVHRLAHREGGDRRRGAASTCPAPHETLAAAGRRSTLEGGVRAARRDRCPAR